MELTCSYCGGGADAGASKCSNCGAPVSEAEAVRPDLRLCPHCRRRLLTLASPACNYCGRRLPEDQVKAREAVIQRMSEMGGAAKSAQPGAGADGIVRNTTSGSLFSLLDFSDVVDLTDLFS